MSKKSFFGCIRSLNQLQRLNFHTHNIHSNIDLTLIKSFYYDYFLPIVIFVIVMASNWSWISMYKYNIFPISKSVHLFHIYPSTKIKAVFK